MQIIFLSQGWTLLLCFMLWPVFQVSAVLIALKIPNQYLSPKGFIFKERKWEKDGELYEKVFQVKRWKQFLPDGGTLIKGGYRKRHLKDYSIENLERFQLETCRGEFSHIVAILPFWIFGLFLPPIALLCMFLYAIIINLPCVIAQRYNRVRLTRILNLYYIK